MIIRFDHNNPPFFAKQDTLSPGVKTWFVEFGRNRNVVTDGDILIYDSETYRLVYDEEYKKDTSLAVEIDSQFGKDLLNEYLVENKALKLTTQQSLTQLQKFQGVKALLEVGALSSARDLLSTVVSDEVFTEERKLYYLNKLNSFIL